MPPTLPSITVGAAGSDIPGFTNLQIQAAVDHVAALGGGEVVLSAGTFRMADSLHLRPRVTVRGQGRRTVLRKNAMKTARIIAYLGYGQQDLLVDHPERFKVGEGILLRDDNAFGFYTTVATLIRREGDVWFTNRPHSHDYLPRAHGVAETLFPVVAAVDADDTALESLRIEGNRRQNPVAANGCRAGGFLGLRAQRLRLRDIVIRDYHGDGLSFQMCDDADIADCVIENCVQNGLHPGSGSQRFRIRNCVARGNGACGLFYCLNVRHGIIEDCLIERNGLHGVSIGERDTDNVNLRLNVRHNGGYGLFFRPCPRNDAPHRAVFEGCHFEDNGLQEKATKAEILVQGEVDGVRLTGNLIRPRSGLTAIRCRPQAQDCLCTDNRIEPTPSRSPGGASRVRRTKK